MPTELRNIYPFRGFTFGDSEPSLQAISTSTGTPLIVQDASDNASNQVAIFRGGNRATAADGDNAYISYTLEDSGGTQSEFARMAWMANDVTTNTKDSKIVWSVQTGNTLTDVWEISSSSSGVVTTSFSGGDIVLPDNVSIQLGNSGADTDLSSDGTDIKWIVPGTADVILGRTGAPSPDTLLHLWAATAGSIAAATNTLLTVENSGTALISILAPTQGGILFGDAADNNVGQITYTHSNDALGIIVGAVSQLVWTDGVMAFQKAMTLSSTSTFAIIATDVVVGKTGAPSPDTLLHVWSATAGSIAAATDTLLTLENSGSGLISILAPTLGGIYFGDAADNDVGKITYTHSNNSLGITVGATSQLVWTDGIMAFQRAMTLSSTAAFIINATGISGTAIKDEDNMASDSATHLASQQSIKAYVTSQIALENELSEMGDVTISSIASNDILQYNGSTWTNRAYVDFTKVGSPGTPALEEGRMYLKEIDSNNNALVIKIQKAGSIQEVELTSPKAVCGECGRTDGASDPTYDFERGMMTVNLWCGHSFEMELPAFRRVA